MKKTVFLFICLPLSVFASNPFVGLWIGDMHCKSTSSQFSIVGTLSITILDNGTFNGTYQYNALHNMKKNKNINGTIYKNIAFVFNFTEDSDLSNKGQITLESGKLKMQGHIFLRHKTILGSISAILQKQ